MKELKELLGQLSFKPKEGVSGLYQKIYSQHNYCLEVDFSQKKINYGDKIKTANKTTSNFSHAENWVFFIYFLHKLPLKFEWILRL